MLLLFVAAAVAATPCKITEQATLLRLADEFSLATPSRVTVKTDDKMRYLRQLTGARKVEFTVLTINISPVSRSYFFDTVVVTMRGRIRPSQATCAEARSTLDKYLAATTR